MTIQDFIGIEIVRKHRKIQDNNNINNGNDNNIFSKISLPNGKMSYKIL